MEKILEELCFSMYALFLLINLFWISVVVFVVIVLRTPNYVDFRGEALKMMYRDASPVPMIFTMGQFGQLIPKLDVSVLEHYLDRMVNEGVIRRELDDGTGRYCVTISPEGRTLAQRLSPTVAN